MVNVSLLAKWGRKLLGKEEELSKEVFVAKYEGHIVGKAGFKVGEEEPRSSSLWWKDICQIGKDTNWSASAVSKKLPLFGTIVGLGTYLFVHMPNKHF